MAAATANRKAQLEARLAELQKKAKGHRSEIEISRSADGIETMQNQQAIDLAVRLTDHEAHLISRIRSALDRLQTGDYGVCLRCEEEISEKRLNALPWAEYCVSCQELADAA